MTPNGVDLPSPHVEDEARLVGHPVRRPGRIPDQIDSHDADAVDRTAFDAYSARGSTRALAAALDLACERAAGGRG